jgi:hypothetical protein
MGKQFDELSKALASGASRRRALRRFLGSVVGAAMVALIPGRRSAEADPLISINRPGPDCVALCRGVCPPGSRGFGDCVSTCERTGGIVLNATCF